jgi:hypothetical protein
VNAAKALTDDEVGILLAAAVLAPSMDNTQPWQFEVAGPGYPARAEAHTVRRPWRDTADRVGFEP